MTDYEASKVANFLAENWKEFVEFVGSEEGAEEIYQKIKPE